MGAMYEKGQTKRYSRVASFSGGGKSKKAKEYDDSEERRISKMAKEGDIDSATDAIMNLRSMQSAGKRIMRGLKPTIDEVVKRRPAMKHGGKVSRYGGGGKTKSEGEEDRNKKGEATEKKGGLFGGYGSRKEQLEAQMAEMKKGGKVESKKMMRKEVAFMKKKGASKSMIKHEEAEMKGKRKRVKKMAVGGAPKPEAMSPAGGRVTPDFLRQLKAFESRLRTQAGGKNIPPDKMRREIERYMKIARSRPRPGRGDSSMPFKSDKMPRPKPRPSSPKSGQMPKPRPKPRPSSPKSGQMPKPRPGMPRPPLTPRPKPRPARPKSGQMPKPRPGMPRPGMPRPPLTPRPGREDSMFGLKQRKAGGAVKTKKYAAGGMIPSAGKKSPSSMGTPYRAGGSIKPKKYSGGGGIDGCAMRGKTRAPRRK